MTRFLLIRHGHVDAVGQSLAGRRPGIHLSELGRRQAAALAENLASHGIHRILCSPLQRAQETARPLADRLELPLEIADPLIEFDFGDWTGKRFDELDEDPLWALFNSFRSGTRPPNGETMLEVQQRIVGFMQSLHADSPQETAALVSHGDVLRAAVCYCLGIPLDHFQRIEIDPASVSSIELQPWGPRVLALNHPCPTEAPRDVTNPATQHSRQRSGNARPSARPHIAAQGPTFEDGPSLRGRTQP